MSKTTKLILLDSLLQEVVATLPHLVLQRPRTAKCEKLPLALGHQTNTSSFKKYCEKEALSPQGIRKRRPRAQPAKTAKDCPQRHRGKKQIEKKA